MRNKLTIGKAWSGLVLAQLLFLILATQVLLIPIVLQQGSASPLTFSDTEWENPPGIPPNNDIWATPFPLDFIAGSQSIANANPLNVSSTRPDYYSFIVNPGSHFSVSITFNQSNVWDTIGLGNHNLIVLDPAFYADLDIYLWAQNGTNPYLLGYSNYSGYEEAIGPVLVNVSDTFIFNVTCSNPLGYELIQYSTTYNMSVVYEDKWERLHPNDDFDDLTPPYSAGGSDDEIVPGHYEDLRFSGDPMTEYGQNDTYWILLYRGSWVNITVSSYLNSGQPEVNGPDIYLYYPNQSISGYQNESDFSSNVESFTATVKATSWYYLRISNMFRNTDYYTLDISLEDAYEVESGPNDNQASATEIKVFGKLPGIVVSEPNPDWYSVDMAKYERLRIDIEWYPVKLPDGSKLDLNLTVYENQTEVSVLDDPQPIINGLRFGPHRVFKDSTYYFHISSNNPYPLYYNLTVVIQGKDDWAEENDLFISAYLLPTQSKAYETTAANPDGGFVSLEGDMDWFAITLLPGDWITVRIEFDSLADLNLFFIDGDANILDASQLSGSSSETIVYNIVKADTYLLLIHGVGSYGVVDYNMSIDLDVFDDEFELPNNDFETAAPIAEGTYNDLILRDDIRDYYYLYLHENDIIEISLDYFPEEYEDSGETYTNDIDLILYSDYDDQKYPRVNESITVFNESLTFTADVSEKYFILCKIDGETPNPYNLTINVLESDDYHEDNDVFGEATRLTIVDTATKDINYYTETLQIRVKDDDYFVTRVPAGLSIIVSITQFGSDNLDLELLSLNGSILDYSTNDSGIPEQVGAFPMNFNYSTLYNGTDVYFQVFMDSGLSTSYFLNITIGPEELLIPRETVPPTKPKPPSKPFDPFTVLIPLAVGGAILGGGTAGGLYAAKKVGLTDKLKRRFSRKPGEESGGTKKKPPD